MHTRISRDSCSRSLYYCQEDKTTGVFTHIYKHFTTVCPTRLHSLKVPGHYHHFPGLSMTFAAFHEFPGLENGPPKFHDFREPVHTRFRTCIEGLLQAECTQTAALQHWVYDHVFPCRWNYTRTLNNVRQPTSSDSSEQSASWSHTQWREIHTFDPLHLNSSSLHSRATPAFTPTYIARFKRFKK